MRLSPRRSMTFAALLLVALVAAGIALVALDRKRNLLPVTVSDTLITLPAGSVIAAEGDSLTYGMDVSPTGGHPPINDGTFTRSTNPFPEALATLLKRCPVVNRGFPGDRSVDGLVRWQSVEATELTILMYGSNDALNNGQASSGIVSLPTFRFTMTELVNRRRRRGSQVVLIVPPPIGDARTDERIDPYRDEVRSIARSMNLPLVDAVEILQDVQPIWTSDNVHLSVAANQRLAEALAQVIHCR